MSALIDRMTSIMKQHGINAKDLPKSLAFQAHLLQIGQKEKELQVLIS